MASRIQQLLNNINNAVPDWQKERLQRTLINNAVYGEEVRSSIHDAIKECYDDVTVAKTKADSAAANANQEATQSEAQTNLAKTATANANSAALVGI